MDASYVGTGLVSLLVTHALRGIGLEGIKRCHICVHNLAPSPIMLEVLKTTEWNKEQKEVYHHDIELPFSN